MGCLESMKYEVLLRDASFRECRDYIIRNFPVRIEVTPGFRIFDKNLIGVPPLYIAIDGDDVIIPYTKPCYGTFLVRVPDPEMAASLRKKVPK